MRVGMIVAAVAAIATAQTADDARKVREHLFQLTDMVGPRVVGSPALDSARRWLEGRLREYGLQNIRREENPPMQVAPGVEWNPVGWSWSRLSVQQLSPWATTLIGIPVLYSAGTSGAVSGEIVVAALPRPDEQAVSAFLSKYRGRLKGKFLLTRDTERPIPRDESPGYRRYTAKDMEEFLSVPSPARKPADSKPASARQSPPPSFADVMAQRSRLARFLKEEGVLGLISGARGEGGTLFVRPPAAPPGLAESGPPELDLAAEHFNRILRLTAAGIPVRLEVNLQAEFHGSGTVNLLADIPGTDKRDEFVVAGAHLDSWHGGTGATDNATGVAVLLEAARMLVASGTAPRRTIRFAFWDGHELGTIGSRAYAARYLKDPSGMKTSCYFNIDYGAGRIRGVYLQGRTELKGTFDEWLGKLPGERLRASPRTTLGSDQASFERVGVPGISFIQDPLNYEQRSHHTSMDLPDYASTDDLKYAVRVLSHLLLEAANSDALLPRRATRE